MAELFIYYRCRAGDSPAVQAAAHAVQGRLREQFPGLEARLLRRPLLPSDETVTWMETYRYPLAAAAAADPSWQKVVQERAASALAAWTLGARHVEVFEACAW